MLKEKKSPDNFSMLKALCELHFYLCMHVSQQSMQILRTSAEHSVHILVNSWHGFVKIKVLFP